MNLLFDLDGTITDPKPGITGAVRYALATLGRPAPEDDDLAWVIGPPLRETFRTLLGEALVERAIELYREQYGATGYKDAIVIPGMPETLDRLAADGYRLFVATSKPHFYARRVLAHFGLADRFVTIHGAELDGTHDNKGELIAHILATEGLAPAGTLMIGDRKHDVLGAARNGVPCIGVAWGYGSHGELAEAGARHICAVPAELPQVVSSLLAAA
jgi:haloacid dehalogenase superfamily, subfamily IA, variant 1 with third motif having Dx(3-4)D or Dx(3-4)E